MKHVCTIDEGSQLDCVFDIGGISDCTVACRLRDSGKGKADCEYWKPEPPDAEDASAIWERKFQEAVKLANQALDLVDSHFYTNEKQTVRTQLEALEKNA